MAGPMVLFGGRVSSGALHLETTYRRNMMRTAKRGPTEREVKLFPKLFAEPEMPMSNDASVPTMQIVVC